MGAVKQNEFNIWKYFWVGDRDFVGRYWDELWFTQYLNQRFYKLVALDGA
jgi:hypothetical protein